MLIEKLKVNLKKNLKSTYIGMSLVISGMAILFLFEDGRISKEEVCKSLIGLVAIFLISTSLFLFLKSWLRNL